MAAENLADSQVTLDVVPSTDRFAAELKAKLTPQLNKLGKQLGKGLSTAMADGFDPSAAKFAAKVKAKLEPQFTKSGKTLGRKLSAGVADGFTASSVSKAVTAASKAAQPAAQAAGKRLGRQISGSIKDGFGDPLSKPIRDLPIKNKPATTKGGSDLGGAFASAFKKRLEAAFQTLPKINLDADSSPAQRKLAELRARMEELSGKTIGVDIDAATASAKVDELRAELRKLGASSPNIQVRADVAAALAELAEVDGAANRLDGRSVNLRVGSNSRGVLRDLQGIGIALAALTSPVTIPLAISGAGILAAGGAAVGAGIGGIALASLPGLKRITAAMQAQKTAQDQVGTSAKNAGSAINSQAVATDQARIKALQMAGAQDQLAAAQQQAAQAHRQALEQVQQAETSLADAQRNAKQAQDALNAARAQAKRDAQDLANSVIDAELNERSAVLSLAEAQQTLVEATQKAAQAQQAVKTAQQGYAAAQSSAATVNANPQSSTAQKAAAASAVAAAHAQLAAAQQAAKDQELEQKRAKLAVDQAVQGLREQRLELSRLRAEKAASDKAGINGDRNVIAARQQVASADEEVRRQEKALSDARRQVGITDADSARNVRAAQRAIQEQLLQNKLATDQGAKSATGATAATQRWGLALGKLTGPERDLLDHITKFKSKYDDWAKSLEKPVFRAFGTWLDTIGDNFGLLSPAVRHSSDAITKLGKEADKSLKGKFWTNFFKLIGKQAGTDTYHLGQAIGNVAKGVAGIVKNFLPSAPSFFKWLDRITDKFKNWATGKKGKQDFGQFMDTAKKNWPVVKDIMKDLWQITKKLGDALSGMAPSTLKGIEAILSLIGKMSPTQLQALIAVGAGAYAGGKLGSIGGGKTGKTGGGFNLGQILAGIGLGTVGLGETRKAGGNKKGGDYWSGIASTIGSGAAIGGLFGPVGAAVGAAGGAAAGNVSYLSSYIPRLFSGGKTGERTRAGFNNNFFNNPFGVRTKATDIFKDLMPDAQKAWNSLSGWFNKTFIVGVRSKFTTAKNSVTRTWSSGWTYVTTWPRSIWNGLSGWFNKSFVPGVRSKFTNAKNSVTRLWRDGMAFVTNRPRQMWNNLSGWFTKSFVPGVRSKFTSAKNTATRLWRDGMNFVRTEPRQVWSDLSNWFTKKFTPGVRRAFSNAVHAISVAWGKVKQAAKTPINFVISTVYDKGIKGTWDKVASWLHLPKSWRAPYIKPLAQGGIERFAGEAENHVAQIAKPGEMRLWAEPETGGEAYVPLAPSKRARSTKILQTVADEFGYGLAPKAAIGPNVTPFADGGIVRRFADGGLWGWVDKTFGSIASKVTNFGKTALSFLANPADYIKGKVTGAINKIPGADSPYGAAGKALSTKVLDQVEAFAKQVASVFGTGGAAMKALKLAETRKGVPYVYGGTNWQSGMDCSGLTSLAYKKAGISIPRTSEAQWGFVNHIPVGQAQPGDLVFAEFGGAGPGHVAFRTQYPLGSNRAVFEEPHCVPTDTEILTRRGWVKYSDVRPGDETLGYNFETGHNEWTPIHAVNVFDDVPVVRAGIKRWHVECTDNHSWVTEDRYGRRQSLVPLRDIQQGSKIIVAAPADTGDGLPITDEEAELLAWAQGDGSIRQRGPSGLEVVFYQSKTDGVRRLEELLASIKHSKTMRPAVGWTKTPAANWRLASAYARDWLTRVGFFDGSASDIVLAMSPGQRRAWLSGMLQAEGDLTHPHTTSITQRDGDLQDAIVLAIYLEGYRPGMRKPYRDYGGTKAPRQRCRRISLTKPRTMVLAHQFHVTESRRTQVWCPTTGLGSWTARQGDHVFLTGNTGDVAKYTSIGSEFTHAGVVPGAHNGTYRGVPGSTAGGRHAGPGKSQAWARAELPELGWGSQFGALNNINNHESSWRWYAANPSGAYGIPQALPGSKMRSAGADWHDNSFTQLKWQFGYIGDRYGSPNKAWSFWQRHHYYADGGDPPPGTWGTTGENGPELQYFGAPSRVFSNEDSRRLTAAAGGDGASVVNEWHAHFDGASRAELRHLTQTEFYRQGVRQAQVARPGRRR